MSLRELFVNKKKELEKLEADILRNKEKQQKKVESVQTEYDALVETARLVLKWRFENEDND